MFALATWRDRLAPAFAAASLAYATALACATGAALDWQPAHIALLVLAVPVAAALLAARISDPSTTLAVEITGAVAGAVAISLSALELPMFALVLALCGVIAAGTAVRPDRRSVGYLAAALFVLAMWVRLSVWNVGSPEAYTLPATVPALLVGALRRRRDPNVSSWTAYGPGLAATLVPSLLTAWSDAHWTRPCCWARPRWPSRCSARGTDSRHRSPSAAARSSWTRCTNSPRISPRWSVPCRAGHRPPSPGSCCSHSARRTSSGSGTPGGYGRCWGR